MPSVNPGPASVTSGQTAAVMAPFAPSPANPFPQGVGALRLLAFQKNVPLSAVGDVAALSVINASAWAPATIAFGNALVNGVSASVAAANLGLFTAIAAGGNVIRTAGVLTGQTTSAVFTNTASPAAAVIQSAQTLYINTTVAVAGGTVDVYVYGYDLSPVSYP